MKWIREGDVLENSNGERRFIKTIVDNEVTYYSISNKIETCSYIEFKEWAENANLIEDSEIYKHESKEFKKFIRPIGDFIDWLVYEQEMEIKSKLTNEVLTQQDIENFLMLYKAYISTDDFR